MFDIKNIPRAQELYSDFVNLRSILNFGLNNLYFSRPWCPRYQLFMKIPCKIHILPIYE